MARLSRLPNAFGVTFGVAVAVGSMIGAGILRAPQAVAALLPSPALFLGVWVLGGVYALLGANAVAEPGTMRPRSGGQFAITREAFGPFPGFVVGWNDWLACCASTAAIAIVLAETAVAFLPASWRAGATMPIALAAVLAAAAVLARGSRSTDRVQTATSVLKGLGFIVLVVGCVAWSLTHPWASTAVPTARPEGLALVAALLVAMQGVIFAYDGWVGVLYFAEEVRDPGRDIPRSLFGGVIATMALYLLINAALLVVLPLSSIATDPIPAATAANTVFGTAGGTVVRGIMLVALPSAVLANFGMGTRVAYGLGGDTRRLAALSGATGQGAPMPAIAVSTLVAMAFVMTGAFERVIALCSLLFIATYAMSFASVFALRRREPDTPRPWRTRGHPYTTGIVLLGSVAFLAGSAFAAPRDVLVTLVLVLGAYPAYRLLR